MTSIIGLQRRAIERWRLLASDTFDYETTVEDPTIFTQHET
jgi:hypothetical protein